MPYLRPLLISASRLTHHPVVLPVQRLVALAVPTLLTVGVGRQLALDGDVPR